MNADIAYIITHPGRYAMTAYSGIRDPRRAYVMLEVADDGTIYQLNPRNERDGVLSPEGFHPGVRCYVTSDNERVFVRVPQPTLKGPL